MEPHSPVDVTTGTPLLSAAALDDSDAAGESAGTAASDALSPGVEEDIWSSGEVPGLETDSLIAVSSPSARPSVTTRATEDLTTGASEDITTVTSEVISHIIPSDNTEVNGVASGNSTAVNIEITSDYNAPSPSNSELNPAVATTDDIDDGAGNHTVIESGRIGTEAGEVAILTTEADVQGVTQSDSAVPVVADVTIDSSSNATTTTEATTIVGVAWTSASNDTGVTPDDIPESPRSTAVLTTVSSGLIDQTTDHIGGGASGDDGHTDGSLTTVSSQLIDQTTDQIGHGASGHVGNTDGSAMDITTSSEELAMSSIEPHSGSSVQPDLEMTTDSVPSDTIEVTTAQDALPTSGHEVTSEDLTTSLSDGDIVSSPSDDLVTPPPVDLTTLDSQPEIISTSSSRISTPLPVQSTTTSPVIPVETSGEIGGVTDATTYGTTSPAMSTGASSVLMLGVGVGVGILLVILLLVMVLVLKKRCDNKNKKNKYQRDEENVQDYQYDIPVRIMANHNDEEKPKPQNGSLKHPTALAQYDNPTYDEIIKSRPSQKNYFHEGIRMEDENDNEPVYDEPKMVVRRNKGSVPMTELQQKSRMSMGPVYLQDENSSSQKIYDTLYTTHNTFKR